ncbi:MAG: tetratricopeptide repeat protein, partial [Calditrichota bacterium]
FRRDHSFRIPRPDLSIEYNVPNACNDCHADKSFQWSEDYIKRYFGERKKFSYAAVLADGYEQKEGADTNLIKLIKNDLYPEIVRATALQYLTSYHNKSVNVTSRLMLDDPEPIVREIAVNAFNTSDQSDFIKTLVPILNDPIKMVRMSAANRLSLFPKDSFKENQYEILSSVLDEYVKSLEYTADFPAGKFNLGNYYSNKGDFAKAEKFYNGGIKEDSLFYPAKSNLALLYYREGKLKEAENLFLDLIRTHKVYTEGEYYLGLLYAEQKRYKEAAEILEKATQKSQVNTRIYYNLGLVYQYLNEQKRAETSLLKAYSVSPDEFDIIYALVDYYIKNGNKTLALHYADEINKKFPYNQTGKQLKDFIHNNM